MKVIPLLTAIAVFCASNGGLAQVPSFINYQGRLSAYGSNVFNGPGQFKFALVNGGTNVNRQATAVASVSGGFLTLITITDGGSGYGEAPVVTITDPTGSNAVAKATIAGGVVTGVTVQTPGRNYSPSPTVTIAAPAPNFSYLTFWSNDGSSSSGGAPSNAVPLVLSQGLFTANLGDTSLSNMSAVIPSSVFTNLDVRLRIWFSDGNSGFQQFYPDQQLTSVGYAMMAANVLDGAITGAKLAPGAVAASAIAGSAVGSVSLADGAVTTPKLADSAVTTLKLADGAVTSAKLADGAVLSAKLAASSVQNAHIGAGAVGTAQIQNGAITSAQIADGTIGTNKLNFNPLVSWIPSGIVTFTNNGTWVKPAGVNRVYVKLWGAGGGGGYGDSAIGGYDGGGGGAGAYCEGVIAVTGNVSVVVGNGGSGDADTGGSGGAAGGSTFLSLTANGGGGGVSYFVGGTSFPGGLGGIASGGSINLSGQNGRSDASGGGTPFGGIGGTSLAVDGSFPGGGGRGGHSVNARNGGIGAAGFVIVYY